MGDRLVVGRIAKAHGIRGEVAIEVLTDHDARFAVGAVLDSPGGSLTVAEARPHQGRLLVRFAEVADRNAAEALRGVALTIDASEAAALPPGRWYPHELEGMRVLDAAGRPLGVFVRVESNPAHDLWVVRTDADRDVLVPVVFVADVDTDAGVIRVDPPEGLF